MKWGEPDHSCGDIDTAIQFCQDTDEVIGNEIGNLSATLDDLESAGDGDHEDAVADAINTIRGTIDALGDCPGHLSDADTYMESVRSINSDLREWGTDMDDQHSELMEEVKDLKAEIETLEDRLTTVEADLEEAMDNEVT